jgi:hypothetical protein
VGGGSATWGERPSGGAANAKAHSPAGPGRTRSRVGSPSRTPRPERTRRTWRSRARTPATMPGRRGTSCAGAQGAGCPHRGRRHRSRARPAGRSAGSDERCRRAHRPWRGPRRRPTPGWKGDRSGVRPRCTASASCVDDRRVRPRPSRSLGGCSPGLGTDDDGGGTEGSLDAAVAQPRRAVNNSVHRRPRRQAAEDSCRYAPRGTCPRRHGRARRPPPGMGTRCAIPAAITGSTSALRVTEIWWPQHGHSGREAYATAT